MRDYEMKFKGCWTQAPCPLHMLSSPVWKCAESFSPIVFGLYTQASAMRPMIYRIPAILARERMFYNYSRIDRSQRHHHPEYGEAQPRFWQRSTMERFFFGLFLETQEILYYTGANGTITLNKVRLSLSQAGSAQVRRYFIFKRRRCFVNARKETVPSGNSHLARHVQSPSRTLPS